MIIKYHLSVNNYNDVANTKRCFHITDICECGIWYGSILLVLLGVDAVFVHHIAQVTLACC